MSTNILPQRQSRVKHIGTETTPEERAARVEAFKHLTPDDYDHLLRVVRMVVPESVCDPVEALAETLVLAAAQYDGSTKLTSYVAKRARWYAWNHHERESRHLTFSDLPTDEHAENDDTDGYIEKIIGGTSDREYTEVVDERFTERIKEILDSTQDSHIYYARPNIIPIATAILDMLQSNANQGQGIGIDEWENAPIKKPKHQDDYQVYRNIQQPLGAIRKKLAETLGVPSFKVDFAIAALRVSTARALHEGWLDYRSNPTA